jgi:rhamnogalacturonan endolyase
VTTTVPATTRHVNLMQDPLYRNDVALVSMGYFYPPNTSYSLFPQAFK